MGENWKKTRRTNQSGKKIQRIRTKINIESKNQNNHRREKSIKKKSQERQSLIILLWYQEIERLYVSHQNVNSYQSRIKQSDKRKINNVEKYSKK